MTASESNFTTCVCLRFPASSPLGALQSPLSRISATAGPLFDFKLFANTMKCKYLGHIINNNLIDDDDIARQKEMPLC